jgi:hypothetical protein
MNLFNAMFSSAWGHFSKPIAFRNERAKCPLFQIDRAKSSGVTFRRRFTRTLHLPEIAELRPRLHSEVWVYAGTESGKTISLTAGISDAVAISDAGRVEVVVDWKSDIDPAPAQIELYRGQVRDYLAATGAPLGLIVFMTSGRTERILLPVAV